MKVNFEELVHQLLHRYQVGLKQSVKDSRSVSAYVRAMFCKFRKISLSRGRSYIDSLQWANDKKSTNNDDDMHFKYAVKAALNRETIGTNLQRKLRIGYRS